ncbi:hypothetical protein Y032_0008g120 [Ancylostoma ceylanicum]|uniref:Uncharacterized protein n=1 Tax=Ancylostoma ceylanicum TaxID=53326 RepID=A0A016VKX9_9BILA|nr:hypothetical protein Y032_0008g120 [Ancylostoma ceylanicum]
MLAYENACSNDDLKWRKCLTMDLLWPVFWRTGGVIALRDGGSAASVPRSDSVARRFQRCARAQRDGSSALVKVC